jgi:hypothetical protein
MKGLWTRFARDYRHSKRIVLRGRGRASHCDDDLWRGGCECREERRTCKKKRRKKGRKKEMNRILVDQISWARAVASKASKPLCV